MSGASACETRERVNVDQKQLMNKILARYATDFSTLRELLQNADDAAASQAHITLHLHRDGSCDKIVVWNNGQDFVEADWKRVQYIARGNQDTASVGMFGVGFYSVFAVADTPEIRSGGRYMRFGYEENDASSYFTYSAELDRPETGTSVHLPLKPGSNALQWGTPEEQGRMRAMLASTLLFARSLSLVQLQLVRDGAPPSSAITLRRELTSMRTVPHEPPPRAASGPGSGAPLFTVARVSKQTGPSIDLSRLVISAEVGAGGALASASIVFLQLRAELDVHKKGGRNGDTCSQLMKEMGKPMPDRTTMRLLYPAPTDGATTHTHGGESLRDALEPLRCTRDHPGRIYVGIGRTEQTCGSGFHLCAQLLPTMERTALDLSNRDGTYWNTQLVGVAGSVALDFFIDEERLHSHRGLPSFVGMAKPMKLLTKAPPDPASSNEIASQARGAQSADERTVESVLTPRLAALLRAHTFVTSTPRREVGERMREGFLAHAERLYVPSTSGAMPAARVHTVPHELHGALEFLAEVALIPPSAHEYECKAFYEMLERYTPSLTIPALPRRCLTFRDIICAAGTISSYRSTRSQYASTWATRRGRPRSLGGCCAGTSA